MGSNHAILERPILDELLVDGARFGLRFRRRREKVGQTSVCCMGDVGISMAGSAG